MNGLIGRKKGMTSIFDDEGKNIPCTVVEVEPNAVTQVKHADGKDGYDAVQLAYGEQKEKSTSQAMLGHFDAAYAAPKEKVTEYRDFNRYMEEDVERGDELRVEDIFIEGEIVDVAGTSKGKGFQGVVKRHGFAGVGMATHGQSDRERAPGSIGASADPSRVFKGMRMAGRTGNRRAKIRNLKVVQILPDNNLLLIKGSVPGPKNGFVEIYKKE